MSASRPGGGRVVPIGTPPVSSAGRLLRGGRTTDGTWRPDLPFNHSAGLKITMRRAMHLTPDGVLEVPMRFQVPVLNEFRRPYRFNWSTTDTVAAGQRARPMGAQLVELQIDTMLMDRVAAASTEGVVVWGGAPNPQRVLDELRFIAGMDDERRGPAALFRLTISQPAVWRRPLVNMVAALTNVEPSQHSADVGTEYLSATFLEVRADEVGRQRRNVRQPTRHRLVAGDDLHSLAVQFFHAASEWRAIADANGIKGVSPSSDDELAAWAKRHHKKSLVIPGWAREAGHPTSSDVKALLS